MTSISALNHIHKKGLFGDYDNKNELDLLKVKEVNNLKILQIVKYKNSTISITDLKIDGLVLSDKPNAVVSNKETRILWSSPNTWLVASENADILSKVTSIFKETDFAVTDLSYSRAIIEIEGKYSKEVLKKGCPFNFNELNKNNCANSIFHGITLTIDLIDDSPEKIRLFVLRSFGESLYHSVTDASLEFGYKSI